MASVTSNMDINILAGVTLGALVTQLDALEAFTTKLDGNVIYGDSVKVEVQGLTKDAAAYNSSSNNFETVGADTTTGVDVVIDQLIKKTAEVAFTDIGRIDITKKLEGLAKSVVYKMLLDSYNTLIAATYTNAEKVVGAASAFDQDLVVDLEVEANDFDMAFPRSLVVRDNYLATLKKEGLIVANMNREGTPSTVWSGIEGIANFSIMGSNIIKDISGTAASENLVGFYTDKSAMAIATGIPPVPAGIGYEVANVVDDKTGLTLQLMRHTQLSTGNVMLNAVLAYGRGVARVGGLTRLVSA